MAVGQKVQIGLNEEKVRVGVGEGSWEKGEKE